MTAVSEVVGMPSHRKKITRRIPTDPVLYLALRLVRCHSECEVLTVGQHQYRDQHSEQQRNFTIRTY